MPWSEMASTVVPLAAALVGTVVGGFVGHLTARRRDSLNSRRDNRVEYLLNAYRALESSAGRNLSVEAGGLFERALGDVLLLGTPDQCEMANEIMLRFAGNETAHIDSLLVSLRSELRRELGLPQHSLTTIPVLRMQSHEVVAKSSASVRFDKLLEQVRLDLSPTHDRNSSAATDRPGLGATGPRTQIGGSYNELRRRLGDLARQDGVDADKRPGEIAALLHDAGRLGAENVKAINGIDVMWDLSQSSHKISSEQAEEFTALVRAILYVL